MHIFLLMILSAMMGGYYYQDSPALKNQTEFSKTRIAIEARVSCLASQHNRAIDSNTNDQYENDHTFENEIPCATSYGMQTRKFCLTTANSETGDKGGEIVPECYEENDDGEITSSHYVITKTDKLENMSRADMLSVINKLSGGMPNIGVVFHLEDGRSVLVSGGTSKEILEIPASIVGEMGLEEGTVAYLTHFRPGDVKAMIENMEKEKLECEDGEIKSYDADSESWECKPFEKYRKCFGDTIENADGECVPNRSKIKECGSGEISKFNNDKNIWECVRSKSRTCTGDQMLAWDDNAQDYTCVPNPNAAQAAACAELKWNETTLKWDSVSRFGSGDAESECGGCQIKQYDNIECMNKCYVDFSAVGVSSANCQSGCGYNIDYCGAETKDSHRCYKYHTIYWSAQIRKWKCVDCFPLQVKDGYNDKRLNMIREYGDVVIGDEVFILDGNSGSYDSISLASNDVTNVKSLTPREEYKLFCTEGQEDDYDICNREGKKWYWFDGDRWECINPKEFGDDTDNNNINDKWQCPNGFTRDTATTAKGYSECYPKMCSNSPNKESTASADSRFIVDNDGENDSGQKDKCKAGYWLVKNGSDDDTSACFSCWRPPLGFEISAISQTYLSGKGILKDHLSGKYYGQQERSQSDQETNGYQDFYYLDTWDICAGSTATNPIKGTDNTGAYCESYDPQAGKGCKVIDKNGYCIDATQYDNVPPGHKRNYSETTTSFAWSSTPTPNWCPSSNNPNPEGIGKSGNLYNNGECEVNYRTKYLGKLEYKRDSKYNEDGTLKSGLTDNFVEMTACIYCLKDLPTGSDNNCTGESEFKVIAKTESPYSNPALNPINLEATEIPYERSGDTYTGSLTTAASACPDATNLTGCLPGWERDPSLPWGSCQIKWCEDYDDATEEREGKLAWLVQLLEADGDGQVYGESDENDCVYLRKPSYTVYQEYKYIKEGEVSKTGYIYQNYSTGGALTEPNSELIYGLKSEAGDRVFSADDISNSGNPAEAYKVRQTDLSAADNNHSVEQNILGCYQIWEDATGWDKNDFMNCQHINWCDNWKSVDYEDATKDLTKSMLIAVVKDTASSYENSLDKCVYLWRPPYDLWMAILGRELEESENEVKTYKSLPSTIPFLSGALDVVAADEEGKLEFLKEKQIQALSSDLNYYDKNSNKITGTWNKKNSYGQLEDSLKYFDSMDGYYRTWSDETGWGAEYPNFCLDNNTRIAPVYPFIQGFAAAKEVLNESDAPEIKFSCLSAIQPTYAIWEECHIEYPEGTEEREEVVEVCMQNTCREVEKGSDNTLKCNAVFKAGDPVGAEQCAAGYYHTWYSEATNSILGYDEECRQNLCEGITEGVKPPYAALATGEANGTTCAKPYQPSPAVWDQCFAEKGLVVSGLNKSITFSDSDNPNDWSTDERALMDCLVNDKFAGSDTTEFTVRDDETNITRDDTTCPLGYSRTWSTTTGWSNCSINWCPDVLTVNPYPVNNTLLKKWLPIIESSSNTDNDTRVNEHCVNFYQLKPTIWQDYDGEDINRLGTDAEEKNQLFESLLACKNNPLGCKTECNGADNVNCNINFAFEEGIEEMDPCEETGCTNAATSTTNGCAATDQYNEHAGFERTWTDTSGWGNCTPLKGDLTWTASSVNDKRFLAFIPDGNSDGDPEINLWRPTWEKWIEETSMLGETQQLNEVHTWKKYQEGNNTFIPLKCSNRDDCLNVDFQGNYDANNNKYSRADCPQSFQYRAWTNNDIGWGDKCSEESGNEREDCLAAFCKRNLCNNQPTNRLEPTYILDEISGETTTLYQYGIKCAGWVAPAPHMWREAETSLTWLIDDEEVTLSEYKNYDYDDYITKVVNYIENNCTGNCSFYYDALNTSNHYKYPEKSTSPEYEAVNASYSTCTISNLPGLMQFSNVSGWGSCIPRICPADSNTNVLSLKDAYPSTIKSAGACGTKVQPTAKIWDTCYDDPNNSEDSGFDKNTQEFYECVVDECASGSVTCPTTDFTYSREGYTDQIEIMSFHYRVWNLTDDALTAAIDERGWSEFEDSRRNMCTEEPKTVPSSYYIMLKNNSGTNPITTSETEGAKVITCAMSYKPSPEIWMAAWGVNDEDLLSDEDSENDDQAGDASLEDYERIAMVLDMEQKCDKGTFTNCNYQDTSVWNTEMDKIGTYQYVSDTKAICANAATMEWVNNNSGWNKCHFNWCDKDGNGTAVTKDANGVPTGKDGYLVTLSEDNTCACVYKPDYNTWNDHNDDGTADRKYRFSSWIKQSPVADIIELVDYTSDEHSGCPTPYPYDTNYTDFSAGLSDCVYKFNYRIWDDTSGWLACNNTHMCAYGDDVKTQQGGRFLSYDSKEGNIGDDDGDATNDDTNEIDSREFTNLKGCAKYRIPTWDIWRNLYKYDTVRARDSFVANMETRCRDNIIGGGLTNCTVAEAEEYRKIYANQLSGEGNDANGCSRTYEYRAWTEEFGWNKTDGTDELASCEINVCTSNTGKTGNGYILISEKYGDDELSEIPYGETEDTDTDDSGTDEDNVPCGKASKIAPYIWHEIGTDYEEYCDSITNETTRFQTCDYDYYYNHSGAYTDYKSAEVSDDNTYFTSNDKKYHGVTEDIAQCPAISGVARSTEWTAAGGWTACTMFECGDGLDPAGDADQRFLVRSGTGCMKLWRPGFLTWYTGKDVNTYNAYIQSSFAVYSAYADEDNAGDFDTYNCSLPYQYREWTGDLIGWESACERENICYYDHDEDGGVNTKEIQMIKTDAQIWLTDTSGTYSNIREDNVTSCAIPVKPSYEAWKEARSDWESRNSGVSAETSDIVDELTSGCYENNGTTIMASCTSTTDLHAGDCDLNIEYREYDATSGWNVECQVNKCWAGDPSDQMSKTAGEIWLNQGNAGYTDNLEIANVSCAYPAIPTWAAWDEAITDWKSISGNEDLDPEPTDVSDFLMGMCDENTGSDTMTATCEVADSVVNKYDVADCKDSDKSFYYKEWTATSGWNVSCNVNTCVGNATGVGYILIKDDKAGVSGEELDDLILEDTEATGVEDDNIPCGKAVKPTPWVSLVKSDPEEYCDGLTTTRESRCNYTYFENENDSTDYTSYSYQGYSGIDEDDANCPDRAIAHGVIKESTHWDADTQNGWSACTMKTCEETLGEFDDNDQRFLVNNNGCMKLWRPGYTVWKTNKIYSTYNVYITNTSNFYFSTSYTAGAADAGVRTQTSCSVSYTYREWKDDGDDGEGGTLDDDTSADNNGWSSCNAIDYCSSTTDSARATSTTVTADGSGTYTQYIKLADSNGTSDYVEDDESAFTCATYAKPAPHVWFGEIDEIDHIGSMESECDQDNYSQCDYGSWKQDADDVTEGDQPTSLGGYTYISETKAQCASVSGVIHAATWTDSDGWGDSCEPYRCSGESFNPTDNVNDQRFLVVDDSATSCMKLWIPPYSVWVDSNNANATYEAFVDNISTFSGYTTYNNESDSATKEQTACSPAYLYREWKDTENDADDDANNEGWSSCDSVDYCSSTTGSMVTKTAVDADATTYAYYMRMTDSLGTPTNTGFACAGYTKPAPHVWFSNPENMTAIEAACGTSGTYGSGDDEKTCNYTLWNDDGTGNAVTSGSYTYVSNTKASCGTARSTTWEDANGWLDCAFEWHSTATAIATVNNGGTSDTPRKQDEGGYEVVLSSDGGSACLYKRGNYAEWKTAYNASETYGTIPKVVNYGIECLGGTGTCATYTGCPDNYSSNELYEAATCPLKWNYHTWSESAGWSSTVQEKEATSPGTSSTGRFTGLVDDQSGTAPGGYGYVIPTYTAWAAASADNSDTTDAATITTYLKNNCNENTTATSTFNSENNCAVSSETTEIYDLGGCGEDIWYKTWTESNGWNVSCGVNTCFWNDDADDGTTPEVAFIKTAAQIWLKYGGSTYTNPIDAGRGIACATPIKPAPHVWAAHSGSVTDIEAECNPTGLYNSVSCDYGTWVADTGEGEPTTSGVYEFMSATQAKCGTAKAMDWTSDIAGWTACAFNWDISAETIAGGEGETPDTAGEGGFEVILSENGGAACLYKEDNYAAWNNSTAVFQDLTIDEYTPSCLKDRFDADGDNDTDECLTYTTCPTNDLTKLKLYEAASCTLKWNYHAWTNTAGWSDCTNEQVAASPGTSETGRFTGLVDSQSTDQPGGYGYLIPTYAAWAAASTANNTTDAATITTHLKNNCNENTTAESTFNSGNNCAVTSESTEIYDLGGCNLSIKYKTWTASEGWGVSCGINACSGVATKTAAQIWLKHDETVYSNPIADARNIDCAEPVTPSYTAWAAATDAGNTAVANITDYLITNCDENTGVDTGMATCSSSVTESITDCSYNYEYRQFDGTNGWGSCQDHICTGQTAVNGKYLLYNSSGSNQVYTSLTGCAEYKIPTYTVWKLASTENAGATDAATITSYLKTHCPENTVATETSSDFNAGVNCGSTTSNYDVTDTALKFGYKLFADATGWDMSTEYINVCTGESKTDSEIWVGSDTNNTLSGTVSKCAENATPSYEAWSTGVNSATIVKSSVSVANAAADAKTRTDNITANCDDNQVTAGTDDTWSSCTTTYNTANAHCSLSYQYVTFDNTTYTGWNDATCNTNTCTTNGITATASITIPDATNSNSPLANKSIDCAKEVQPSIEVWLDNLGVNGDMESDCSTGVYGSRSCDHSDWGTTTLTTTGIIIGSETYTIQYIDNDSSGGWTEGDDVNTQKIGCTGGKYAYWDDATGWGACTLPTCSSTDTVSSGTIADNWFEEVYSSGCSTGYTQSSATCNGETSAYCTASRCTAGDYTGNECTASFQVPYLSGTCFDCGTPPPPLCVTVDANGENPTYSSPTRFSYTGSTTTNDCDYVLDTTVLNKEYYWFKCNGSDVYGADKNIDTSYLYTNKSTSYYKENTNSPVVCDVTTGNIITTPSSGKNYENELKFYWTE